jgi:hypothetical protein
VRCSAPGLLQGGNNPQACCRCLRKVMATVSAKAIQVQTELSEHSVPLQGRCKVATPFGPDFVGAQAQLLLSSSTAARSRAPSGADAVVVQLESPKRGVPSKRHRHLTGPLVANEVWEADVSVVLSTKATASSRALTEDGAFTSVSCGSLDTRHASSSCPSRPHWRRLLPPHFQSCQLPWGRQ